MIPSNASVQSWFERLAMPAALLDSEFRRLIVNESFKTFFRVVESNADATIWQQAGFELSPDTSSIKRDLDNNKVVGISLPSNPEFQLRFYPSGSTESPLILAILEPESGSERETLRKTLDEAIESNRLKSAFLANMSHEIRTPLNTIIGFSDLIIDEELTHEEILNLVGMIKTSGKSLLQLVEDIIDISRIEAGQVRFNPTQVKLGPVFQEMLKMFENQLNKRRDRSGVELRTGSTVPADACVFADIFRFRQILINLLSNAVKFTESGYIEFGYLSGESGMIQFYVKDTGVGIDPALASKVFQRFGQLNQPGIHNREGAGLGMAITKQLVELMGGQIWFDSQPGKGSTFYFTLPACQPFWMEQQGDFYNELFEWSNEIFLIVDDVEANYLFLRSLLKSTGALQLWAKNGEEAIRYCRSNPDISLVLMDIQMPKTDGYEATRKIKELNPGLPIIAQTAFADNESKAKAIKAGCNDFITKPINKHELLSLIDHHLKRNIM